LDDAHAAEHGVVVDRDGVDAVVLDGLGVPGLHAHFLEDLADEVLELVGGHRQQVRAAVQPGYHVHAGDEFEAGEQGLEVNGGLYGLQVVRVRGDQGVEASEASRRVERGQLVCAEYFSCRAYLEQQRPDRLAGRGICGG